MLVHIYTYSYMYSHMHIYIYIYIYMLILTLTLILILIFTLILILTLTLTLILLTAESDSDRQDPLAVSNVPPDLVVDSSLSSYTLILNKYNTFKLHTLLVTNTFELQSHGLNLRDIQATIMYIQAISAVGFFNSGEISGASQPHKHIQLVPVESLRGVMGMAYEGNNSLDEVGDIYTFPMDMMIRASFMNSNTPSGKVTSLNQIPFEHYVAYISILTSTSAQDIYEIYLSMREKCKGKEYNFIVTMEWMMMVPRSEAAITMSLSTSSSSSSPSSSSSSSSSSLWKRESVNEPP